MQNTAHEVSRGVRLVKPARHSAPGAFPSIDAKGFRELLVLVDLGTSFGGTSFDAKVLESDQPASGFADVPGAAITPLTLADSQAQIRLNLEKRKRYIQVEINPVGGDWEAGVTGYLSNPTGAPVTLIASETINVDP